MSRISRASLLIAFFFAIDKVIGFVRQALFSRVFSPNELDIFLTSNNIPDLLSALISGGALSVAFIPVLAATLEKEGRPAAWALFTRVLNLAFLTTAAIAAVIILMAEPLVSHVTAPGFDPAKQALTAELMRLDLAAILIFSVSGLVMAGLQANQHFLLPALAPAFYNLGQIFGAAVLAPKDGLTLGPLTLPAFGLGLHGLVYGVILGALLHLGIQLPGLLRYQFHWSPALDWKHPGVRQVLRLMGPRVISMFCLQVYFVTRDNFASHLPSGSVTVLNYGWFVMQVPETLIGTAIAIALLPSLAEQIARGERAEFTQTVNRTLRVMLAMTLPAAALLMVGIDPLLRAAFDFPAAQSELLAWATRAFLAGLFGHAWLEVATRSFYAHQNAVTPLMGSILQIGLYFALAAGLSALWGVVGLALADTLAFSGQALVLLVVLTRRFPGALEVRSTLGRAVCGAALGALLAVGIVQYAVFAPVLLRVLAALALGGLAALPWIWAEVKLLVKL